MSALNGAPLLGALGAKLEIMMTPDHHDLALAITSHLPHLIAYSTVGTPDDLAQVTEIEVIKFSAGVWRLDASSASDPTMWRDVFPHHHDQADFLRRNPPRSGDFCGISAYRAITSFISALLASDN
ncbi:prephenate dehydrogenase/arogenate dehydrogenase family protein [Bradyrhizobium sp. 145]|nr:prephenate dehydrogenase/arogenate dehydrogenase family protein [Bradyrhizobium sp. 145]